MVFKTFIFVAILLVAGVPAVILPVTDLCGMHALLVPALKLARSAFKLGTSFGFVRLVTTVILSIALPPEGDTFVRVLTQEHAL